MSSPARPGFFRSVNHLQIPLALASAMDRMNKKPENKK